MTLPPLGLFGSGHAPALAPEARSGRTWYGVAVGQGARYFDRLRDGEPPVRGDGRVWPRSDAPGWRGDVWTDSSWREGPPCADQAQAQAWVVAESARLCGGAS